MVIVVGGKKGGETKIALEDGSGIQKSFLNAPYVKRALGDPAEEILRQTNLDITKKQIEKEKRDVETLQQNSRDKDEEIQALNQGLRKEQAKIDQLKETQGPEYE